MGTWYSGQEHRVWFGIDGLLLIVVLGDSKLVIPVDHLALTQCRGERQLLRRLLGYL